MLSGLAGLGTSAFQIQKDPEHRELLYGRAIQLHGKPINTSFDSYGEANIVDLVSFALTYGDKRTIQSLHGNNLTEIALSYIPDKIGSGITKWSGGQAYASSGICLMSIGSTGGHEHSFAILDDWVRNKFPNDMSSCRLCKKVTPFGFGVCNDCFAKNNNDWKCFVDPDSHLIL
jgi:hypothetical protein